MVRERLGEEGHKRFMEQNDDALRLMEGVAHDDREVIGRENGSDDNDIPEDDVYTPSNLDLTMKPKGDIDDEAGW